MAKASGNRMPHRGLGCGGDRVFVARVLAVLSSVVGSRTSYPDATSCSTV